MKPLYVAKEREFYETTFHRRWSSLNMFQQLWLYEREFHISIQDVQSDGLCFYRSVAWYVYGNASHYYTVMEDIELFLNEKIYELPYFLDMKSEYEKVKRKYACCFDEIAKKVKAYSKSTLQMRFVANSDLVLVICQIIYKHKFGYLRWTIEGKWESVSGDSRNNGLQNFHTIYHFDEDTESLNDVVDKVFMLFYDSQEMDKTNTEAAQSEVVEVMTTRNNNNRITETKSTADDDGDEPAGKKQKLIKVSRTQPTLETKAVEVLGCQHYMVGLKYDPEVAFSQL